MVIFLYFVMTLGDGMPSILTSYVDKSTTTVNDALIRAKAVCGCVGLNNENY